MPSNNRSDVVRACFAACRRQDRAVFERALTEDATALL
jgi:ketosteroid isomerase-like protein